MALSQSQINELIRQAYEHAARKFIINKKNEDELLAKLALISESSAIPVLLPLVFTHNQRLIETVANVIHRIAINIPVNELDMLDELVRKIDPHYFSSWGKMTVGQIENLNFAKPVANTIYTLLASHRNGYIREYAIKKLSPEFATFNIPILLIRANDWVNEISQLASSKLIEFINDNKIADFIPSLNLLYQLQQKERYDHKELISKIENQLIEKCYDKLLLIVSQADKKTSRIAFNIAAKDISRLPQLNAATSHNQDIILKLRMLKVGSQYFSAENIFELLEIFSRDKSAIVRRNSIYVCLEKCPQHIHSILINTLFDKSLSLRELARFYLKDGDIDMRKIYQDALINQTKSLPIVIMGLAELGHQEDFKLIQPYLLNSVLNVRAACIYAIFKLKPSNQQALILEQLSSSEPVIIKAIYTGLLKNSDDFAMDEIENIFNQKNHVYAQYLLIKLKVITCKDRWDLINYLLDQIKIMKNAEIKIYLENKISRWIIANHPNKIFTQPSKDILLSILAKADQLILQGENVDLYQALKVNIISFVER